MEKTNVMRILDQKKVSYQPHYYGTETAIGGMELAETLGKDPNRVFKTLVSVSSTNKYYVFDIPVNRELNLKKAAKAVGEKKIEMLKQAQLLPLTGYIHGGCSPIGMKKFFTTTFDQSVEGLETVTFSAGKIGYQVELSPEDLKKVIRYTTADLCD
jgi:Cys-tRNA(Pro)/Cys-tRNA(Cys) deacylase